MVDNSMKRFLILGVLSLFFISIVAGVVSAEDISAEAEELAESVTTGIGGFFGTLLGPLFGEEEMLSRVFFAILLGMIIYSVISVMFGSSGPWIQWGITGAITSLALIGLPSDFLMAIRTQYGAMGATILMVIPFIIIFLFSIRMKNIFVARMTWIFYATYSLVMYINKVFEVGGLLTTESIPYSVGFFLGIIVFFLLPTVRTLMFKGEIKGLVESGMNKVQKRKAARAISDANLTAETDVKIE